MPDRHMVMESETGWWSWALPCFVLLGVGLGQPPPVRNFRSIRKERNSVYAASII